MKRTRNTNQGADTSPHLSKNPKAYPTSSSMSSTTLLFNNVDSSLVCEIQLKIWIRSHGILNLQLHPNETFYNLKYMIKNMTDIEASVENMIIIDSSGQIYNDTLSIAETSLKNKDTVELLIQKYGFTPIPSKDNLSVSSATIDEEDFMNHDELINDVEIKLLDISRCHLNDNDGSSDEDNGDTTKDQIDFNASKIHHDNSNLSVDADEKFVAMLSKYRKCNLLFNKTDNNKDTILHNLIKNFMVNSFFQVIKLSQHDRHILDLIKMKNLFL